MGVLLDFGSVVLDGTTVLSVPFAANGESAVVPCIARSDTPGEGRPGPNPLRIYSDRVRAGLTAEDCLEAAWGEGLADVGGNLRSGSQIYLQFRRLPEDAGAPVPLTDAIAMISTGFVVMANTAAGISVSVGTGAATGIQPAASHGVSVSSGSASATADNPPGAASAHGVSVSRGSAIGAQLQPAAAHGTSVSKGTAAGEASAPSATRYYLLLNGTVSTEVPAVAVGTREDAGNLRLQWFNVSTSLGTAFSVNELGGQYVPETRVASGLAVPANTTRFASVAQATYIASWPLVGAAGKTATISIRSECWYDEDNDMTGFDLHQGPDTWIEY